MFSPIQLALRSGLVRKTAMRLSDLDFGRSRIDAALHAHAAERLARRCADEASRRVAYAAAGISGRSEP